MFSGLATLSLNWMQNLVSTLVLCCIFEAFTSILEAVLFCVAVDIFPTNLRYFITYLRVILCSLLLIFRAICLGITASCGRIGAIFGSFTFGYLINVNCVLPIYLFGLLLIGK